MLSPSMEKKKQQSRSLWAARCRHFSPCCRDQRATLVQHGESEVRRDKPTSGCVWRWGSDACSAAASLMGLCPPGVAAGHLPWVATGRVAQGTRGSPSIVRTHPCACLQCLAFSYLAKPKLYPEKIPTCEWVKIETKGDIKCCMSKNPSYCSQLWKKMTIVYAIRPLLTFCFIFFPPAREQKQAEPDSSHFYNESQSGDAQFSVPAWEGWADSMRYISWSSSQVHSTCSGSFH